MRKPPLLTLSFLSLILNISLAQGGTTGDDIGCLKALNASVSDPNGYLSSWDFTNTTAGSICKFNGIECWNQNENRILNIRLSNMGLKGHFPSGLQLCESLTGLDLSGNNFTGSIPLNISAMVCNL
jgi:Leucine rich repeat N-terminal domain